jgi:hypothetical protein
VEGHIEGFSMIEKLFGKATGSSESPSDPVPEPAVILLYPHGVRFAG